MKIPLTQDKQAIIDDADYELISQYKWYAYKDYNTWYARTNIYGNGEQKTVLMHRLLCGSMCDGKQIDHKNHNGLDNRRSNIRVCSQNDNQHNQRPRLGVSKYKGVGINYGKWHARIRNNGKYINLGRFDTEEDAAKAYNEAALKYFGEFACLNQIEGGGVDEH